MTIISFQSSRHHRLLVIIYHQFSNIRRNKEVLQANFTAGWVIDVKWKKLYDADSILVIGKVRHSYSSKEPLKPWVLIKSNGSVVCGHCTCMAGQGETCSHVGAVLYWVEAQVRIREQLNRLLVLPKKIPG